MIPGQDEAVKLSVRGVTGVPYTATLDFKSKDTTYTGIVGMPLPIKISGASEGFEVVIDILVDGNGNEVRTQTSFVPK